MHARKVLIVDDNTDILMMLEDQFSLLADFESRSAETGARAIEIANDYMPDVILMDIGLPDIDGREVTRKLRQDGFRAPIIALTGRGSDTDIILGLEAGANDYVVKPYRFEVLLARVRTQLQQYDASEDAVFRIGPFSFRPGNRLLQENHRKVKLTSVETEILRLLHRADQKPVDRETLLREIWGLGSTATTHTIETHVYRLRQKMEKDSRNPEFLVTAADGYSLKTA